MKYFMKSRLLYKLNVNPRFLNETNHESGGQFYIFHLGALLARIESCEKAGSLMQDHAFGIDEIGIREKVGGCEERSTRTKSVLDKLQLK